MANRKMTNRKSTHPVYPQILNGWTLAIVLSILNMRANQRSTETFIQRHPTIRFIKGFPWDVNRYSRRAGRGVPRSFNIESVGGSIEFLWVGAYSNILIRSCT